MPVRQDNYAYLLVDDETKEAAAIDIFDVEKVTSKAKEEKVDITMLVTTHHHQDHSGGNEAFVRMQHGHRRDSGAENHHQIAKNPDIPVYGGSSKCPALTVEVSDEDVFAVGANIIVKYVYSLCSPFNLLSELTIILGASQLRAILKTPSVTM